MAIYNGTDRYVVYYNGQRYVDSLTKPKCPSLNQAAIFSLIKPNDDFLLRLYAWSTISTRSNPEKPTIGQDATTSCYRAITGRFLIDGYTINSLTASLSGITNNTLKNFWFLYENDYIHWKAGSADTSITNYSTMLLDPAWLTKDGYYDGDTDRIPVDFTWFNEHTSLYEMKDWSVVFHNGTNYSNIVITLTPSSDFNAGKLPKTISFEFMHGGAPLTTSAITISNSAAQTFSSTLWTSQITDISNWIVHIYVLDQGATYSSSITLSNPGFNTVISLSSGTFGI